MNAAEMKKTEKRIKDILVNQIGDISDLNRPAEVIGVRKIVEIQSADLDRWAEVNLIGSEKQVAWARALLEGAIKAAKKEIEGAVLRVEDKSMPKDWAYDMLDAAKNVIFAVVGEAYEATDVAESECVGLPASDIINKKGQLSASLIDMQAKKAYEARQ